MDADISTRSCLCEVGVANPFTLSYHYILALPLAVLVKGSQSF